MTQRGSVAQCCRSVGIATVLFIVPATVRDRSAGAKNGRPVQHAQCHINILLLVTLKKQLCCEQLPSIYTTSSLVCAEARAETVPLPLTYGSIYIYSLYRALLIWEAASDVLMPYEVVAAVLSMGKEAVICAGGWQ